MKKNINSEDPAFKDLNPKVRKKAIFIARQLQKKGVVKKVAIEKAVHQAKQWALDKQA